MEILTGLIFRTGLVGVFAIAAFAFLPSLGRTFWQTSKEISNLDTKCWTPAHFTFAHVEFANDLCGDQVRRNVTQSIGAIGADVKHDLLPVNGVITGIPKEETFILLILYVELTLLFTFHVVMSKTQPQQNQDEKANQILAKDKEVTSEVKVRSSFPLLQFLGCLMMTAAFSFLATFPYLTLIMAKPGSTYHSGESICTFKVRQLERITTFSLQCFYSYEESPGVDIQRSLLVNSALCGLLAFMSAFKSLALVLPKILSLK